MGASDDELTKLHGTSSRWGVEEGPAVAGGETMESGDNLGENVPVAYRLQRLIGQGGFGEVWESVQISLSRPVAVKRVREDIYSQYKGDTRKQISLERTFRMEALTTALLEHPNIPPVHDLGIDEDGRPLLAMKLIRGRPWDDFLHAEFREMPVNEYLARHLPILAAICQAVAFAHSRGIVHRDLKPSQVMVGEYGEVHLMDWGLAVVYDEKLLPPEIVSVPGGVAPHRTRASSPAGTPAYMAPEQCAPTAERVGPWTDVYLLGGILYHILTLKLPHRGETSDLVRYNAAAGVVAPPHQAAPDREIPVELAALAMKAMAPDPKDRIGSAREFLKCLQEYQSGTSKRRESIMLTEAIEERLKEPFSDYKVYAELNGMLRNARNLWPENPDSVRLRNRLLIDCAGLALMLGDLRFARVQAELLDLGADRDQLLGEIERREDEDRRQAQRLEGTRRRLNDQHERAEELIEFMLGDLGDKLQSIGRLDLLDAVGEKALNYFQSLPAEIPDRTRARGAQSLCRIAGVRLAQGKLEQAWAAADQALDMARDLAQREPDAEDYQQLLAMALGNVGKAHRTRGNLDAALQAFREQNEIYARLVEAHSAEDGLRLDYATSHDSLADVFAVQGNIPSALLHNAAFRELTEILVGRNPANAAWQRARCSAIANFGWLRKAEGDDETALDCYRQSLDIAKRLAGADPGNARHRSDVAFFHNKMAWVLESMNRPAEAVAQYRQSLPILRDLVSRDPLNAEWRLLLSVTHSRAGTLLESQGMWREALEEFAESVRLLEDAVARDPGNVWNRNWLAHAHVGLGRIHRRLNGRVDAQREWERAAALMKPAAENLEKSELRHIATLAQALFHLGRESEARPLIEHLKTRNYRDAEFVRLLKAETGG